ncbi:MAG: GIY-YIG nuclease family protein [candidate division Zixibacteria bacterium]|nr:GIY-YIG nuclease family protein [candidate division Zixibacteria bacterium]
MSKRGFVYILTNKSNKVLYTGVTSDLIKRIYSHKNKSDSKFTPKYKTTKLVYYEIFDDIYHAIQREKQIKAGSRDKKLKLIENFNPNWIDLYDRITGQD